MLNNQKQINKKGFTLVEIMTVLALFGIFSTLALSFITTSFKATRFESEQAEAVKQARDGMSVMKREIRGAIDSEAGAYAISEIDDNQFEFYADTDDDDEVEKIKYYVDNIELKKTITDPGPLHDYAGTGSTITIANYINNHEENIFTYYDSDYSQTSQINLVRLINIKLKINVTPEIAPADVYVETDVTLRNVKSNL